MHSRCRKAAIMLTAAVAAILVAGCYSLSAPKGGAETRRQESRTIRPTDVALPAGYRIEVVAQGLTFPSGVTFDDQNRPYVIEAGYSYGEKFTAARLLRIEPGGKSTEIVSAKNGPWTGVAFLDGAFYVAQGGVESGGAIVRIDPSGTITPLVENLPSLGDHHTNGPAIGKDGFAYFGVGTATNSAVVGEDNAKFGWLKRHPKFHDVPAKDIKLVGVNYKTKNALAPDQPDVQTGAFLPFGTPSQPGQVIKGRLPCTGAVMRVPLAGGPVELVAWGFRNPWGLAFSPEGRLFVTDNMYDVRGSRPVWGAGDVLWQVQQGQWYGWPDYHAGQPLNDDERYKVPGNGIPAQLIAEPPGRVPEPAAILPVHGSACGIDFCRSSQFGHAGELFVASFGDMGSSTGKVLEPVGFNVLRIDTKTGVTTPFAINRGTQNGPATKLRSGGLERPVSVRFDNTGNSLYVVDFGIMTVDAEGTHPVQGTGVLWRIWKEGK